MFTRLFIFLENVNWDVKTEWSGGVVNGSHTMLIMWSTVMLTLIDFSAMSMCGDLYVLGVPCRLGTGSGRGSITNFFVSFYFKSGFHSILFVYLVVSLYYQVNVIILLSTL